MWLFDLPFAFEPLWQEAQVPGVTVEWLNVAGVHAVVRWHESHAAAVGMWLFGLPFALEPLWQVAQVPAATLEWLNEAGVHPDVR